MKHDMELIRQILLEVQEHPGERVLGLEIPGYAPDDIFSHVELLLEQGHIKGILVAEAVQPRAVLPRGLTWKGHKLLDHLRNETVWAKFRQLVAGQEGSVSLAVAQKLLANIAKSVVGLS